LLADRVTDLSRLLDEAADDYAAKRIARSVFIRLCGNYHADLAAAEDKLRRAHTGLDAAAPRPLAGPEAAARWDAMAVSQRPSNLDPSWLGDVGTLMALSFVDSQRMSRLPRDAGVPQHSQRM
jgi:hypothetical protein